MKKSRRQRTARKVLLLQPEVHAQLKSRARDAGMFVEALGNGILRAWNDGDYFRCPQSGMGSMPRGGKGKDGAEG